MNKTNKLIFLLTLLLFLEGCASGAFSSDPYRKQWSGLIGGAYGYGDNKISSNSYSVYYVDPSLDSAILYFDRRAREICSDNGMKGYVSSTITRSIQ